MLYQLSHTLRYRCDAVTLLLMCGFIAQLVEHRTGIAEVTGYGVLLKSLKITIISKSFACCKLVSRHPLEYENIIVSLTKFEVVTRVLPSSKINTHDMTLLRFYLVAVQFNRNLPETATVFQIGTVNTTPRYRILNVYKQHHAMSQREQHILLILPLQSDIKIHHRARETFSPSSLFPSHSPPQPCPHSSDGLYLQYSLTSDLEDTVSFP